MGFTGEVTPAASGGAARRRAVRLLQGSLSLPRALRCVLLPLLVLFPSCSPFTFADMAKLRLFPQGQGVCTRHSSLVTRRCRAPQFLGKPPLGRGGKLRQVRGRVTVESSWASSSLWIKRGWWLPLFLCLELLRGLHESTISEYCGHFLIGPRRGCCNGNRGRQNNPASCEAQVGHSACQLSPSLLRSEKPLSHPPKCVGRPVFKSPVLQGRWETAHRRAPGPWPH